MHCTRKGRTDIRFRDGFILARMSSSREVEFMDRLERSLGRARARSLRARDCLIIVYVCLRALIPIQTHGAFDELGQEVAVAWRVG